MAQSFKEVSIGGINIPLGLYINGEWTDTSETFQVQNPSTEEIIAQVSHADSTLALKALDAASKAQLEWASWAPRKRANLFHGAYDLIVDRADAFAEVMVRESGKPLAEAKAEFGLSADFFLWYTEQIAHLHGSYAHSSQGGYRVITTHRPVGPSFLVTPWNFPFLMIARKGGAALAAGCTVITKSARETPLTSALFVKTLADAGFPKGVMNLIHTKNSAEVSEKLMNDSRLRKISFTGSTGVGTTLLKQASSHVINSSMELGGDGPFVVLDNADIDNAVKHALICKYRNAGQACVAANRIIVEKGVVEEFTHKFVEAVKKLKVGDGFDTVDVGPIISAKQLASTENLVAALKAVGSDLLTGGKRIERTGFFFEPTVFKMNTREEDICNQELFAPIATIYSVEDISDAISFANRTKYGLSAYLFTEDINMAIAVSESLEFGMVGINRGIMADPAAPFGGIKSSGIGREGGQDGIYEFLEPQYLALTVDDGVVT